MNRRRTKLVALLFLYAAVSITILILYNKNMLPNISSHSLQNEPIAEAANSEAIITTEPEIPDSAVVANENSDNLNTPEGSGSVEDDGTISVSPDPDIASDDQISGDNSPTPDAPDSSQNNPDSNPSSNGTAGAGNELENGTDPAGGESSNGSDSTGGESESDGDSTGDSLNSDVLDNIPDSTGSDTLSGDAQPENSLSDIADVSPQDNIFILYNVTDKLNVRSGPSKSSDKIGVLPANSYGDVIEEGEEFTKISCNGLIGYVSNDYIKIGEEAIKYIDRLLSEQVYIVSGCSIRNKPSMKSQILGSAKKGTSYPHSLSDDKPSWNAIILEDGTVAYVSSNYSRLQ